MLEAGVDLLDTWSALTFLKFGAERSSSEYNPYSSIAVESFLPILSLNLPNRFGEDFLGRNSQID